MRCYSMAYYRASLLIFQRTPRSILFQLLQTIYSSQLLLMISRVFVRQRPLEGIAHSPQRQQYSYTSCALQLFCYSRCRKYFAIRVLSSSMLDVGYRKHRASLSQRCRQGCGCQREAGALLQTLTQPPSIPAPRLRFTIGVSLASRQLVVEMSSGLWMPKRGRHSLANFNPASFDLYFSPARRQRPPCVSTLAL